MFSLRGAGLAALAVSLAIPALAAADQPGDPAAAQRVRLPEAAEIDLALSAAPPHLRATARVLVFGPTGFREAQAGARGPGAGGLTCLVNRDGFFYGAAVLKPTCWDRNGAESYVPVMRRVGELLAQGAPAKAIEDDIEAGFADGRFHSPTRAGVAYMLAGDLQVDPATGAVVRQAFPGHYMFYAVGIGNDDLGYSKDGAAQTPGLPFVFARGAGGARLGYIISGHDHGH